MPRETEQLVAEIDDVRAHLAATIDTLIDRAHPKSILRRSVANVKAKFVDENGPRFETIVPVVATVAGTIAAVIVVRRLTR